MTRVFKADDLNLTDGAQVISSAQKFIIPVPALDDGGDPLVYPDGEKAGQAITNYKGEPIGATGVVFFNATDKSWQAVPGDGNGVIIINKVSEDQARSLYAHIENTLGLTGAKDGISGTYNNASIAGALKAMTLAQIKDTLAHAHSIGLSDMYNSDKGFIQSKMSAISAVPGGDHAESFGFHKRDDRDICKAVYIPGSGEFEGPAATPQKFENGAVIVQQGNNTRLIQANVFVETYRKADGTPVALTDLPVHGGNTDPKLRPSGSGLG